METMEDKVERLRQQQAALRAAHQRNERDLAGFPQVLVEHPRYGRAVVRGGSNCEALEQAALLWGMTPQDLGDGVRVWQLSNYQAQHPELGEPVEVTLTREELVELAQEKVPETVLETAPGEMPALSELHFTRNPNHGSWTVEWFDGGGVRHRVRVYGSLGERVTLYQVKLGCWCEPLIRREPWGARTA